MRRRWWQGAGAALLWGIAACGGGEATSGPSDAGGDALDDVEVGGADAGPELDVGDDVSVPAEALAFFAPRVDPGGGPWPLRVHALEAGGGVDASRTGRIVVALELDGQAEDVEVWLRRGVGSVTRTLPSGVQTVAVEGRTFEVAGAARRELAGELRGGDLQWGPDELIVLTADTHVPAGETLRIGPGTLVRLAAGANLDVDGDLEADGEAARPILLAPDAGAAWGGVAHRGRGRWRWTFFVGGGGDVGRVFGHSNSQPVIFAAPGADLELEGVAVQDGPGKALGAQDARITLREGLITRVDTGGELERTVLEASRTWFVDLPSIGLAYQDDDNDGLYLKDARMEQGVPVPSRLEDCVFMFGLDDGVDHNGAVVELERLWIEGFVHEGVAASTGGRVTVRDTVVAGCEQGIEAGYGSPELVAEHVLLVDNGVGARYGDSYTWEVTGSLRVRDSVFLGNREQAVRDLVLATNMPGPPGAVVVEHSLLDDASWAGGEGNVAAAALLTDQLLLSSQSPGRGAASDGADPGLLTGRPR